MFEATAYELLDLMGTWKAENSIALTGLMSLVSGYLIVAYMVGSRLTRAQVLIITGLLLWFAGVTIFQMSINLRSLIAFNEYDHANFGGGADVLLWSKYARWIVVSGCIAAVLASLKFMWDVRHPKVE
jgi:hypothetical protein